MTTPDPQAARVEAIARARAERTSLHKYPATSDHAKRMLARLKAEIELDIAADPATSEIAELKAEFDQLIGVLEQRHSEIAELKALNAELVEALETLHLRSGKIPFKAFPNKAAQEAFSDAWETARNLLQRVRGS